MTDKFTFKLKDEEFFALNNVHVHLNTCDEEPWGKQIEDITITGNSFDMEEVRRFLNRVRTEFEYTLELDTPYKILSLRNFIRQAIDDVGDLYEGCDVAEEIMNDIDEKFFNEERE